MARRRYLLAYDIRHDRRLQLVARCAEAFGDRIQYSVFVCDLSEIERVWLKTKMEELIEPKDDSVIIIDLGSADETRFEFLGQRIKLPDHTALII